MKIFFRLAGIAGAGLYLFNFGGLRQLNAQTFGTPAVGPVVGVAAGVAHGGGNIHVAPVVGQPAAVRTSPFQQTPVISSRSFNARQGYVKHVPSGVGVGNHIASRGAAGFSVVQSGNGRDNSHDQHRHHAGYRVPYYYGLNPDYGLGYYGSSFGGYGYPSLYVQNYGYPIATQQFEPDEGSTVYVEPSSNDEESSAPATPPKAVQPASGVQEPDSLVQDVQSELIRRGYFSGKATGIVSKDFQTALRRFQTDEHLAGTGLINQASLFALGLN